jgi:hypothetical protein
MINNHKLLNKNYSYNKFKYIDLKFDEKLLGHVVYAIIVIIILYSEI